MEPRYYVPELSEFHVGFECEIRSHTEHAFQKATCIISESFSFGGGGAVSLFARVNNPPEKGLMGLNPLAAELDKFVRVKYLDEQDILECGWKSRSSFAPSYELRDSNNNLYYLQDGTNMVAPVNNCYRITLHKEHTFYLGEIKNVSELRFIMKRLGIK